HIDTIWVIDRDTDRVVWAWGPGELLGPHMPTMLPNGHILVYDNGQNASTSVRGYTRVLEIEPIAGKIVWQYKADPPKSFYSPSRGSNERLPNGNTFIAESDSGRAFEVTRDGEIVWDFVTPDRHRNGRPQALYRVCRYGREPVDRLLKEHKK
ncbi:MAG: arylsulfotransferase family protein, partial [Phycisphaerae bacterium]